jgi:hypothetical protein
VISFTSWPNDRKSRAQWWDARQASIPITVGASLSKNAIISLRRNSLRQNHLLGGVHTMKLEKMFDVSMPIRLICSTNGPHV